MLIILLSSFWPPEIRCNRGFPGGASGKEPTCQCRRHNRRGFHPLEEDMATHSSILAWRIPWTEEPGGLQSTGLQRVKHYRSNIARTHKLLSRSQQNCISAGYMEQSVPYLFWPREVALISWLRVPTTASILSSQTDSPAGLLALFLSLSPSLSLSLPPKDPCDYMESTR